MGVQPVPDRVWVISLGVNPPVSDQPPSKECHGGVAYKVDKTRQFPAIMGVDVIRFTGSCWFVFDGWFCVTRKCKSCFSRWLICNFVGFRMC